MARTKKLPDKPSELIRVALEDLAAIEKMKKTHRVFMGDWHSPWRGKCNVCFAGSVMARTLGVKPDEDAAPNTDHFDRDTCSKLDWLDLIRTSVGPTQGFGQRALEKRFRRTDISVHLYHEPPSYSIDPKGFKASMRKLAKNFEILGL